MMRDITLQVPLSDGTTSAVTGKEIVPGLAVTPQPHGGWALTHVRSGLNVGGWRTLDIEQAAAAALRLGQLCNWDCHGAQIIADLSVLGPRLRAVFSEWIPLAGIDMDPTDLNVATP